METTALRRVDASVSGSDRRKHIMNLGKRRVVVLRVEIGGLRAARLPQERGKVRFHIRC